MAFDRIAGLFAAAVEEIYGHRVTISLSKARLHTQFYVSKQPIWYVIESNDPGPSYLNDMETCIYKHDAASSFDVYTVDEFQNFTDQQQLDILLEEYAKLLTENRDLHKSMTAAIQQVAQQDRDILPDLRIRKTWESGGNNAFFSLRFSWTGYGDDLRLETQYHEKNFHGSESVLEGKILKEIKNAANMARQNQKAAERGYTFDLPLQAFLAANGYTTDDLLKAAFSHGFSGRRRKAENGMGPMQFAGQAISISFVKGHVTGKIAITDKIAWSKGTLTARGYDFPDSVLLLMKGKPLRNVIDHPWLEGLVVTNATVSKSNQNKSCTTFMTKAA